MFLIKIEVAERHLRGDGEQVAGGKNLDFNPSCLGTPIPKFSGDASVMGIVNSQF